MKKIIISTQSDFDKIKTVAADEEVIFESDKIELKHVITVFGILRLKGEIRSENAAEVNIMEYASVEWKQY